MSLTVALTGATGFVGKAVLPRLLAAGHQVKALVRDQTRLEHHDGAKIVVGDLENRDALFALTAGSDVVLHLAGAIKGLTPKDFMTANTEGTKSVALAAQAAGVKRMVFVSSLAARRPEVSAYAASKRAAEDWLRMENLGFETLVLRPGAIYGEGDEATLPLLAALLGKVAILPGLRHGRFSLIHVDDFATICVDALMSHVTGLREVDDLSGGHVWSDLVEVTRAGFGRPHVRLHLPRSVAMGLGFAGDLWSRISGKPAMLSADKMREFYMPDWTTRGEGWPRNTQVELSSGLVRTIRWYQARGLLPQPQQGDRSPVSRQGHEP